jgi:hypothetical protein
VLPARPSEPPKPAASLLTTLAGDKEAVKFQVDPATLPAAQPDAFRMRLRPAGTVQALTDVPGEGIVTRVSDRRHEVSFTLPEAPVTGEYVAHLQYGRPGWTTSGTSR